MCMSHHLIPPPTTPLWCQNWGICIQQFPKLSENQQSDIQNHFMTRLASFAVMRNEAGFDLFSQALFSCARLNHHISSLSTMACFSPRHRVLVVWNRSTFALRCGWTTLCKKLRVEHSDASTCPCQKKGSSAKNSIHHYQISFVTLHYQHQHRSQNSASDGLCVTL